MACDRNKNLLVLGASLALALLFIEGIFTFLVAPVQSPPLPFATCDLKAFIKDGVPHYRPNQECLQCYGRNLPTPYFDQQVTRQGETFECIRYRIGENGFRTPPFSDKETGQPRIVVLGDSFTFGEGVKEEDTFPRLIETELGLETVNLAMQGLNTPLERRVFEHHDRLQPDLVILVYIINDTMPVMETIRAGTQWVQTSTIPGWVRFSNAATFLYHRLITLRQARNEIENLRDWFRRGWSENARELRAIKQLSEHRGARFLLVLFPFLIDLEGSYPFAEQHRTLGAFARENGIAWLDLLPAFQGKPAESYWVHPLDLHPNAAGHRIAFNEIRKGLDKLRWP